jgi:hypothetical protein
MAVEPAYALPLKKAASDRARQVFRGHAEVLYAWVSLSQASWDSDGDAIDIHVAGPRADAVIADICARAVEKAATLGLELED